MMRIEAPDRTVCQHTGAVADLDSRSRAELLEENADLRVTIEGLGLENAALCDAAEWFAR